MTDGPKTTTRGEPERLASELAEAESRPAGSADAVLQLVRELLEQDRSDEALAAIDQYAASLPLDWPTASDPQPMFDARVSDQELELAFESASPDREQMLDADEIAARAIRQTDPVIRELEEIPAIEEDFVSSGSSYVTRTVATLVERQGDSPTASRIRAIVDSSQQPPAAPHSRGDSKPPVRDRRTATITELERWLANLRGVAQ
ncbi:MAG: hypothetical protein VCE43_08185 [Myxococcota bacterium]